LLAEFERLLFRGGAVLAGVAPQQRMAAGLRRGGDAAADRLENFRAAKVRNQ
jgi:hypothetical protein